MDSFADTIRFVTGPLTLVAFLALVALALYRRSVKDERGLEYVYNLFREKLTRKTFYGLASRLVDRAFWAFIVVFVASLLAFVAVKLGAGEGTAAQRLDGDTIITGEGADVVVTGGGDAIVNHPSGSSVGDVVVSQGKNNLITSEGSGSIIVSGARAGRARVANPYARASAEQRDQPEYRIDVWMDERTSQPLRELYGLRNVCTVDARYCSGMSLECDGFEAVCALHRRVCGREDGEIRMALPEIEALDEESDDFCEDNSNLCANGAAFCRQALANPPDLLPSGVFGFQVPWLVGRIDLDTTDTWVGTSMGTASLEIHKRPSGTLALVGFVDAQSISVMNDAGRTQPVDIVLHAMPHGEVSHAVSIPLARVESFIYGRMGPGDQAFVELSTW